MQFRQHQHEQEMRIKAVFNVSWYLKLRYIINHLE
jgi:hypothetical protein